MISGNDTLSATPMVLPFRVTLQYGGVVGQFNGPGLFRDRDQIALTFAYLLN